MSTEENQYGQNPYYAIWTDPGQCTECIFRNQKSAQTCEWVLPNGSICGAALPLRQMMPVPLQQELNNHPERDTNLEETIFLALTLLVVAISVFFTTLCITILIIIFNVFTVFKSIAGRV